jgi:hypothetical protein
MAASFSDKNGCSLELSDRFATYWIGIVPRTWYARVGFCAKANDVAATEAVVASEIARLRMNERENRTIFISEQSKPLRVDFSTAHPYRVS